jgi:hypothetical protein
MGIVCCARSKQLPPSSKEMVFIFPSYNDSSQLYFRDDLELQISRHTRITDLDTIFRQRIKDVTNEFVPSTAQLYVGAPKNQRGKEAYEMVSWHLVSDFPSISDLPFRRVKYRCHPPAPEVEIDLEFR